VWGHDVYVDERTVDVHVGRLRKTLSRGRETDPIRTVRGMGYAFDERYGKPVANSSPPRASTTATQLRMLPKCHAENTTRARRAKEVTVASDPSTQQ
jgi:DNA-binding winged helix-turn-helix (wHTH) protein